MPWGESPNAIWRAMSRALPRQRREGSGGGLSLSGKSVGAGGGCKASRHCIRMDALMCFGAANSAACKQVSPISWRRRAPISIGMQQEASFSL